MGFGPSSIRILMCNIFGVTLNVTSVLKFMITMEVASYIVLVVQRWLPFITPLSGTFIGLLQRPFLPNIRSKVAPILVNFFLIWCMAGYTLVTMVTPFFPSLTPTLTSVFDPSNSVCDNDVDWVAPQGQGKGVGGDSGTDNVGGSDALSSSTTVPLKMEMYTPSTT